jgi:hypothetical protein
MEKDIVPALLELIESEFDDKAYNNTVLKKAIQALSDKKATYEDANEFAIEIGEILAQVLNTHITVETLPNGQIYFNIADRIMNSTMQRNYDLITGYAIDVQTELNYSAGLKLKGKKSALNQSRIDGIVERLSTAEEFEEIKWILDEPIKNFSQSIVDDMVRTNAEFQAKAGLDPKIVRRPDRDPCDWCKNLVGEYDYNEVSDQGNDVFRRHDYCRCTVTFEPRRGNSTSVHSGTGGSRKYVKDKYGGYELSKKARIKRSQEMAKTEKARRDAARKKRIDTWARKTGVK